jgi:hypothetical protein
MIPRNTVFPWIVTLIGTILLTAAVSSLALFSEFREAKWIVEDHPPLPPPVLLLRLIFPYIGILPFLALAFGNTKMCRN